MADKWKHGQCEADLVSKRRRCHQGAVWEQDGRKLCGHHVSCARRMVLLASGRVFEPSAHFPKTGEG